MTFNTELWNGQAPGAAGGYEIERSLRFNSGDSSFLSRTPSSAGNLTTFTIAGWVKRTKFGSYDPILLSADTSQTTEVAFTTNNEIQFVDGPVVYRKTNAVFRDPSAWYHVVVVWDSTNATDAHRCRIYVNGVEQSYQTNPSITSGTTTDINTTDIHYINRQASTYGNCYHADVHFIDGQALDPTSFGEFDDNGVWQPIEYTGSYPGNSFYLDFADNSSTTSGSNVGIGKDVSDNGNYWDSTNISIGASYIAGSTLATPINAFDGSTSTSTLIDTTTRVLTNQSISVSSQFEIYTNNFNLQTIRLISGGNTYQFQNHPTNNYTVLNNADSQNNTPFTGTLTGPISIVRSAGSAAFYAVRVDGTVLVDDPAGNDSLRDSPTNGSTADDTGAGGEVPGNYATLNPLDKAAVTTLANGNLDYSTTGAGGVRSTIGMSSGKYYAEVTVGHVSLTVGIASGGTALNNYLGANAGEYGYGQNGYKLSSTTQVPYGDAFTTGDVIGIAFDADAGDLYFYKNGTIQASGTPAFSGLTNNTYFFAISNNVAANTCNVNFGQRPFAHPVSGYKALCTANLDDPTIADGSTAMDVALYTGNGTSQTISGLNFSPDFVWIKNRSVSASHTVYDTIRGAAKALIPSSTSSELSVPNHLTAFTSDGFSVGSDSNPNGNGNAIVAWTWDGGGEPTTDNVAGAGNVPTAGSAKINGANMTTALAGSIPATRLSANTSAGFSVVTYTGNGSSGATVGHGLNGTPGWFTIACRNTTNYWDTWHSGYYVAGSKNYIRMNETGAAGYAADMFQTPTPSVVTLGTSSSMNGNGNTYVMYCWTPVEGYSAFGSYSGDTTNFPFIYTGFRPRWILIKVTNDTANWLIYDAARSTYNVVDKYLLASSSNLEGTFTSLDILSNGFKFRGTDTSLNQSAKTYIYAAFAEHPQKYSRAR